VTAAFALFTAYFSLGVQLMDFADRQYAEEWGPVTAKSTAVRKAIVYMLRQVQTCIRFLVQRKDSQVSTTASRAHLHKFSEDFLLALSDQQLVTGLAILVAGWINRKDSSVYQFEMVTDLAWMSSDVHLLTVGQLRGYFKRNSHARHWRAIGMLCTFVLIFVANVYQGHFAWFDRFRYPAQCLFNELHRSSGKIHGKSAAYMYIWAAFLVYGYARAIIPLYLDMATWRTRLLSQRASLERHGDGKIKLYLLDTFWVISSEAFNVLVIQTLWFIYGNYSIFVDRRDALSYGVADEGGGGPWSLGQIVPLFLLALPVLNALDFFLWFRRVKVEECERRVMDVVNDKKGLTEIHGQLMKGVSTPQPLPIVESENVT